MDNKDIGIDLANFKTEIIKTSFSESFEIITGDLPSEYVRKGEYLPEFALYEQIFARCKPRTCLDIGSNIGVMALFFARHCESVYAFEPNPYIFPILQRNIERSRANVRAFPFGLAEAAAELQFHAATDWNTGVSSFVANDQDAAKYTELKAVRVEAGDAVIAAHNIPAVDFIKIDTEGYEANVLLGLERCIKQHEPVVALEWNHENTKIGFSQHALFKNLFSGYVCFGFGSVRHKHLHPTLGAKIRHKVLKKVLKTGYRQVLQQFVESPDINYDLVFLLPGRFAHIVKDFAFMPKGYVPGCIA